MPWDRLVAALPSFMLASLRVGTAFAAVPAPFGSVTPARLRLAAALLVSFAAFLGVADSTPPLPLEPVALIRGAFGELLIGAVIGMTVRVTLAAAEVAGAAIGQSIGLGFAGSVDPTQGDTMLPTSVLLANLATLIFFAFDGHHTLIAALAGSLRVAPVGQQLAAVNYDAVVQLTTGMMARGLQISAPVVATMFIVQLGTALASRAAPRVHLFAFSFSIVVAAGSLVLWLAAPALCTAISVEVHRLPDALAAVLGGR